MNTNPDIDKKYDRFVGKKLAVVTIGSEPYTYQDVDDKDPTLLEIESEAAGDGFIVRVWLPNTIGTMDYNLNRVNVRVNDDGVILNLGLG